MEIEKISENFKESTKTKTTVFSCVRLKPTG